MKGFSLILPLKKLFPLLLLMSLLVFPYVAHSEAAAVPTPEPLTQYRQLKSGMTGHDVYLLKIRLYQLGYYVTDKQNDQYNANFVRKIKEVQAANGLEQTGIATPELQHLIFSDRCVPGSEVHAPVAEPTASPVPVMPSASPELPELDSEGFIPQGSSTEFVYENESDGLWYYISDSLNVEIRRYSHTKRNKLQWFETHVRLRGIEPTAYSAQFTKLTADSFVSPVKLARENKVVLGISDDSYTLRTIYNRNAGIVVHNGELIAESPHETKRLVRFPNLDVIAFMPDGTISMYDNGEVTAEYIMSLGARNVYSFGPILLQDGKESIAVRYSDVYSQYKEPRCAIGMIEPNHFVILTVVGRTSYSDGCTLAWLAERMKQIGANQAFNLDGGGSAAIVFMGKILNKANDSAVREITDIIGFGNSELVGQ